MASQQLSPFQVLHYREKKKENNTKLQTNFQFLSVLHLRVSHYSTVLPQIILADASYGNSSFMG